MTLAAISEDRYLAPTLARVGVRGRQRLPRPARHARGGRARARRRRDPQRLPRDVADRLPRGRLRARPHRPDDRQRDRRLDHPPVRRRRAVQPRHRQGAPLRARARHEDRHPAPRGRVRDRARAAAARVLDAARLVRAPPPRRHVATRSSALDSPVRIAISSELVTHGPGETSDDPRRGKGFAEKVLVPVGARADGARAVLELATRNSGLELAVGMEHEIDGARSVEACAEGDGARVVVLADLEPGEQLSLSKYVAYHWSAAAPGGDLVGARRPHARPCGARRLRRRSSASTRGT